MPKLAQQILAHDDKTVRPQFKGFAVGDGCLGTETGVCGGGPVWWHLTFLYGHGQISTLLYDEIVGTCGFDYLKKGGKAPRAAPTPYHVSPSKRVVTSPIRYADLSIEPEAFASSTSVPAHAVNPRSCVQLYDDCIYSEGVRRRSRRLHSMPGANSALAQLGFDGDEFRRSAPPRKGGVSSGMSSSRVGEHNSPMRTTTSAWAIPPFCGATRPLSAPRCTCLSSRTFSTAIMARA